MLAESTDATGTGKIVESVIFGRVPLHLRENWQCSVQETVAGNEKTWRSKTGKGESFIAFARKLAMLRPRDGGGERKNVEKQDRQGGEFHVHGQIQNIRSPAEECIW
jgi:hypothetical protein